MMANCIKRLPCNPATDGSVSLWRCLQVFTNIGCMELFYTQVGTSQDGTETSRRLVAHLLPPTENASKADHWPNAILRINTINYHATTYHVPDRSVNDSTAAAFEPSLLAQLTHRKCGTNNASWPACTPACAHSVLAAWAVCCVLAGADV